MMNRNLNIDQDFRMVHKLIKKTAKEMAACYYEHAATSSDIFYRYYPNTGFFVSREWRRFIRCAKETLTDMLTGSYPDSFKAEIYEALLLDQQLPYSPQETQIVNVPH